MKILTEWGFTRDGWRGQRGEYWVLAQALLLLGFVLLPVWRAPDIYIDKYDFIWYLRLSLAAALGLVAAIFLIKGLLDLGSSLTPLPYPRVDGQLVRTGVYSLVRHPIYSGVILAAFAWTVLQLSLSHLIAAAVFLAFFDAKARREEVWLTKKYPDYPDYRACVKKLIPWLY